MAERNDPKKSSSKKSKKSDVKDDSENSEPSSPIFEHHVEEDSPESQARGDRFSGQNYEASTSAMGARPKEKKLTESEKLPSKVDSKSFPKKDERKIPQIPPPPSHKRRTQGSISQSKMMATTQSVRGDAPTGGARPKGSAIIKDSSRSRNRSHYSTHEYSTPVPEQQMRDLATESSARRDAKRSNVPESKKRTTIRLSKSVPSEDKESSPSPKKGFVATFLRKAKSLFFKKDKTLVEMPQDSAKVAKDPRYFRSFPKDPFHAIPVDICDDLSRSDVFIDDNTGSIQTYINESEDAEKCSDCDSEVAEVVEGSGENDTFAVFPTSINQMEIASTQDVDDALSDVISNPDSELEENLECKAEDDAIPAIPTNVRESATMRMEELRFIDSSPDRRATIEEDLERVNELETQLFRINVTAPVDISVGYASSADVNSVTTSIRYDTTRNSFDSRSQDGDYRRLRQSDSEDD